MQDVPTRRNSTHEMINGRRLESCLSGGTYDDTLATVRSAANQVMSAYESLIPVLRQLLQIANCRYSLMNDSIYILKRDSFHDNLCALLRNVSSLSVALPNFYCFGAMLLIRGSRFSYV